MSESTRKFGKRLEEYVLTFIKDVWPSSRLTSNSGAVFNDGDIVSPVYFWDCKNSDKKGFSIPYGEWKKASHQARENGRIPILVRSNREDEVVAQIPLEDLMELIAIAVSAGKI
jgi:hypothetical protein